jgi:hypothetical protein
MQAPRIDKAPTVAAILEVGDQVHVDVQDQSGSNGRILGFYAGDRRRVVVVLPSGVQLIASELDVSLV